MAWSLQKIRRALALKIYPEGKAAVEALELLAAAGTDKCGAAQTFRTIWTDPAGLELAEPNPLVTSFAIKSDGSAVADKLPRENGNSADEMGAARLPSEPSQSPIVRVTDKALESEK